MNTATATEQNRTEQDQMIIFRANPSIRSSDIVLCRPAVAYHELAAVFRNYATARALTMRRYSDFYLSMA